LRFEPATLQVIGGPVPILEGVRRTINPGLTSGAAQYSVSDNGSLIYIQGPVTSSYRLATLCWLDQKGGVEPLKLQPGPYIDPRIAPDGKQIAFATDDGKEANIWVYELSGTRAARRLTLGGNNRYPTWSADGRRIAFQSDRESDAAIFWQQADGTGSVERLTKPEKDTQHVPDSFSPDGKVLLMDASKSSNVSLMALSLEDRKAAPFGDVHSTQPTNAAFSPDGKWVAYAKRATAAVAQVYVQPFPPNGQPYQITKGDAANAHHPFWSRDGRDLFYIPGATQFALVHITTRPTFSFSDAVPLSRGPLGFFEGGPTYNRQNDAAADGRVLAVVPGDRRQVSMMGVSGVSVAPPIQVVLNWSEELKARVPTK
jgi:Tol biopolymer transport system component